MYYLIEISTNKIIEKSHVQINFGGKLGYTYDRKLASGEIIPADYKWITGQEFINPVYNGVSIVEGISIPDLKKRICNEIDATTQKLIGDYIEFDGSKFSTSQNAQLNWTALNIEFANGQNPMYPATQLIPTYDNFGYSLTVQKTPAFLQAIYYGIKNIVVSGATEKQIVMAMASIAELKNYEDPRK